MAKTEKKIYSCEKCERVFDRKGNLDRHVLRIHLPKVKNLVCSVCSKSYSNIYNLKTHFVNAHNGQKMTDPKSALVSNKSNYLIVFIFIKYVLFST